LSPGFRSTNALQKHSSCLCGRVRALRKRRLADRYSDKVCDASGACRRVRSIQAGRADVPSSRDEKAAATAATPAATEEARQDTHEAAPEIQATESEGDLDALIHAYLVWRKTGKIAGDDKDETPE